MIQQYKAHSGTPDVHGTVPAPRWRVPRAGWGLTLVEVVIGYEWLISGLNKLLNAQFRPGLAHALQGMFKDNPNQWWVSLTRALVLPHAQVWAALVQIGELLIALGYFAGALLWLSGRLARARWARWINGGVILALLGGALLTANYYLMAGHMVPDLAPSQAFNEGISIDGLATLLALALLAADLLAQRWRSAAS